MLLTKAFRRLWNTNVGDYAIRKTFFVKQLVFAVALVVIWYIMNIKDLKYIFHYKSTDLKLNIFGKIDKLI